MRRKERLRLCSKILLNNFWGHMGMREILPKTRNVKTYSEFVKFFTSNTTNVLDSASDSGVLIFVQYQLIDDASDVPQKSNVQLPKLVLYFTTICRKSKTPQIYYTATPTASCTFKTPTICRELEVF